MQITVRSVYKLCCRAEICIYCTVKVCFSAVIFYMQCAVIINNTAAYCKAATVIYYGNLIQRTQTVTVPDICRKVQPSVVVCNLNNTIGTQGIINFSGDNRASLTAVSDIEDTVIIVYYSSIFYNKSGVCSCIFCRNYRVIVACQFAFYGQ